MKNLYVRMGLLLLAAVVWQPLAAAQQDDEDFSATTPRLYCGTDASGFSGMDGQLAVIHTNGPATMGPVHLYSLDVPLNSLTPGLGFLWSGQPEDVLGTAGNTLRKISLTLPPTVIATVNPGSNSFSSSCCNEQMVVTSTGFYHAHWSDSIQKLTLDSSGNSEVVRTFPQSNVVGMSSDGTNIWISNWTGLQVGIWDPATNGFTPMFTAPATVAALAWDVANGVLWVGMENGSVIPYDSTGVQLGDGFQPFGPNADNVDGLAFVP
jgi:hypothetical protein